MNPYESPEAESRDRSSLVARKRRYRTRLAIILILCGLLLMIIGFGVTSATYHSSDPNEEQILRHRADDLGTPILMFSSLLTAAGALCFAAASKLTR
jgi:formate hydrogenlyase subunit 3/multisubunit Na+/H+ antiporter MnhD subunit